MTGSRILTCPSCGVDLVLEMDPDRPSDAESTVLLADPLFRFVCPSEGCSSGAVFGP